MPVSTRLTLGFSLVELSIVLVILGLLTGGILGGRSLIRAAEIRSISSDYQNWLTAHYGFQARHDTIAGDMTYATRLWGSADGTSGDGSGTDCTYNTATDKTCNGNGDGKITLSDSYAESYLFWQHLGLAGFIAGTYTGSPNCSAMVFSSSGYRRCAELRINTPPGKIQDSGWYITYVDAAQCTSTSWCFPSLKTGHYLYIGGMERFGDGGTDIPERGILTPAEAWSIDQKSDDGQPATGRIYSYTTHNCVTDATEAATYNLQEQQQNCKLIMRMD